MTVAPDFPRRHNLKQAPCSVVSGLFPLLLLDDPWCQSYGVDASLGTRLPNSALLMLVIFCNGLHVLQRKVSLTRGENSTYLTRP